MTDDPRDILRVAGAECAEVETFYGPHSYADEVDVSACFEEGDAAILALARLVAELEAKAGHDEDNLEGLQHALVRANQQYTQAEAELAKANTFIELLKGMVEQLEGDEFEGYDLDELLKLVRDA